MNPVKQSQQFSELELIHKILSGETAHFELIIRRYNPYLYKVGRGYGFSHADTEDIMQDTYISVYTHLRQFASRSSFKTWLVKIMLNHCYRKKKKSGYRNEILTEQNSNENSTPMFTSSYSDTGKTILNRELGHVLENALNQIPEAYRMVFVLRELNGMNLAETSETLNISETNVKVRLNRAKKMLGKEIEKMYTPEDIYEFNLIYCDRMVERVMKKIDPAWTGSMS